MTEQEFRRWAAPFPDALMLVARSGAILAGNSALWELLQIDEKRLTSKSVFDFASHLPDGAKSALRLWSGSGQMVSGPVAFEALGVGKLRFEGAVIRRADGGATEFLIVRVRHHEIATGRFVSLNRKIDELSTEILGRQRSEAQVREERERYHVTLSSIGDAVIATDINGSVDFMNPAAQVLTGWTLEDARGRPLATVFRIFSEGVGRPVDDPVKRVLKENRVVGLANHTVLRAKSGMERPVEDSAAPIHDAEGNLTGVVLVFRDVSEKKSFQAALNASERRFSLWTELNVIATGIADLVGTFLEANDALLQLLGFSREELTTGRFRWIELTPPEQLQRDREAIAEARARGACLPYEKEYIHKQGHRVPVILGYAIFHAVGRYEHQKSDELAICFIVDISERKRAESLLEQRVAERTALLERALADLEAFSYTISHDLRAPLRSMQSYARYLLEDYGAALNEEAHRFLQKIIRSGEHLDSLIRDVLTFARVSDGRAPLGPMDTQRLLRDLIERYPNLAEVAEKIEIAPDIPALIGNDALFTQCFSNLLGNAIKFVPPNRNPHVKIWGEPRGSRARLWVQDNGIGIEPAEIDRIFGMFERCRSASGYEGTGIGLSIVRRAAEKMEGTVGVESTVGTGSRFWVELRRA